MNNVVYVRPARLEQSLPTDDGSGVSAKLLRSALSRLYQFARTEGLENTAMTLELAMTAIDVDYEDRRA